MLLDCIPFVGFLLSLVLLPQFVPHFWERWYGGVVFLWVLASFAASFVISGFGGSLSSLSHVLVGEFAPFAALIGALYIIAGGLILRIHVFATPLTNVLCLFCFTLLANVFGTTGAAMLGIHPLLRINKHRRYRTHTVLFFIFLVCNIGGSLSPIGDPPLFLGFKKGISFFWPLIHLWKPFFLIVAALLFIYGLIDWWFFRHEKLSVQEPPKQPRISVEGRLQILLAIAVSCVLVGGSALPSRILFCGLSYAESVQLVVFLFVILLSFRITPLRVRYEKQKWTLEPLKEVLIIFVGIFVTVEPVIQALKLGASGPFAHILSFLNQNETPGLYFWITGLFSSILDNAPTYLVFFATAGGDPTTLMGGKAAFLKAISLGAVFMGALTYIGNAPNLLSKAVAEGEYKVPMPRFLGYLAWSFGILIPLFGLIGWLFL